MQNITLLVMALEYIEKNINENLKTTDIAQKCFCSKSTLEKLFRCVNDISVQEYIKRRRMVIAASVIANDCQKSIIDIAFEYGYSSHEAFARAFKKVWNCNPSDFRERKYFELYPRFRKPLQEGDDYMMHRKSVDISELYDVFCKRKDCWFICCDIKQMIPINNISREAGDRAIIETMRRMDAVAGDDDMVFRIGGDEFCILTSSNSKEYANNLVEKISEFNGKTFNYLNQDIPLTLFVTCTSYTDEHLKYNDLFQKLHMAIKESKKK